MGMPQARRPRACEYWVGRLRIDAWMSRAVGLYILLARAPLDTRHLLLHPYSPKSPQHQQRIPRRGGRRAAMGGPRPTAITTAATRAPWVTCKYMVICAPVRGGLRELCSEKEGAKGLLM